MWIPYCTSYYETGFCKTKARELRQSGEYDAVRLGSYLKENGKTYCKIYVKRKVG